MRKVGLIRTLIYAVIVLTGAMHAVLAAWDDAPAVGPLGPWFYKSLPTKDRCEDPHFPAAYQVEAPIGPELFAFVGSSKLTMRRADPPLSRIGAMYDSRHRIGLFYESNGNELRQYLLIANVGAPPVAVKEKDLSVLSMGGRVHLGDTLDKVRSAFSVPSTFHLTTMSGCGFPPRAGYSAVIFYGPPHHPPTPKKFNHLLNLGPDIETGQALGYVVFRANRVAILMWHVGVY